MGVGCTCSPRRSRYHLPHEGVCPRRSSSAAATARSLPISGHTQKFGPFIFSNLRTLFPARNPQPSRFHALAHSLTQDKNLTLAFPVTSKLFLRSLAQERKSTPLLSRACARFCRNGGSGQMPGEKTAHAGAVRVLSTALNAGVRSSPNRHSRFSTVRVRLALSPILSGFGARHSERLAGRRIAKVRLRTSGEALAKFCLASSSSNCACV